MTERVKGIEYGISTTDEQEVTVQFCHKVNGEFKHGVTDEEILDMLIARYYNHMNREESKENVTIYTYLRQAKMQMLNRKRAKSKKAIDGNDKGHGL